MICCPGCEIVNFEINLSFLIKPLINQEVKTKILISQEQKKVFKIKQNNFSSTSIFIIPQKKFLAHFWVGGFTLKKMY